jgi:hypothetical protein
MFLPGPKRIIQNQPQPQAGRKSALRRLCKETPSLAIFGRLDNRNVHDAQRHERSTCPCASHFVLVVISQRLDLVRDVQIVIHLHHWIDELGESAYTEKDCDWRGADGLKYAGGPQRFYRQRAGWYGV